MEKYECIRTLGEGSFGKVYLVRHKVEKRLYCLKYIKLTKVPEKERVACKLEVQLLQRLKHPNIVGYIESFVAKNGNAFCIVMTYCDGGDLSGYITAAKNNKFNENKILHWFVQMALGLHHMHENNILHRDLKSQNIFLLGNGRLVLGDLGISKPLNGTMDFANTCIGTPYYMSPEVFANKPYNHKSDIWSLGCVLYELTTLKHAFDADSLKALAYKIDKGKYPPIASVYSANLRELIASMLSHHANQRPSLAQILEKPFIKKHIYNFFADIVSRPIARIGEGTMCVKASIIQSSQSSQQVVLSPEHNEIVDSLQKQLHTLGMQEVVNRVLNPQIAEVKPLSQASAKKIVKEKCSALKREEERKKAVESALNKLRKERDERIKRKEERQVRPSPGVRKSPIQEKASDVRFLAQKKAIEMANKNKKKKISELQAQRELRLQQQRAIYQNCGRKSPVKPIRGNVEKGKRGKEIQKPQVVSPLLPPRFVPPIPVPGADGISISPPPPPISALPPRNEAPTEEGKQLSLSKIDTGDCNGHGYVNGNHESGAQNDNTGNLEDRDSVSGIGGEIRAVESLSAVHNGDVPSFSEKIDARERVMMKKMEKVKQEEAAQLLIFQAAYKEDEKRRIALKEQHEAQYRMSPEMIKIEKEQHTHHRLPERNATPNVAEENSSPDTSALDGTPPRTVLDDKDEEDSSSDIEWKSEDANCVDDDEDITSHEAELKAELQLSALRCDDLRAVIAETRAAVVSGGDAKDAALNDLGDSSNAEYSSEESTIDANEDVSVESPRHGRLSDRIRVLKQKCIDELGEAEFQRIYNRMKTEGETVDLSSLTGQIDRARIIEKIEELIFMEDSHFN